MRKLLLLGLMLGPVSLFAQEHVKVNDYEFTPIQDHDVNGVQDQYRTGTCWSFSSLSFLESESKRIKNMDVKLAEMWIVRHTYIEKAERYIRFHGNVNFEAGGAFHDATAIIEKYGIVPQSEYSGLNYGTDKHIHSELNAVLKAMCQAIVKNPNRKLTTAWKDAIVGVIDAYLGAPVSQFEYQGKSFNPKSFADHIGIKPSDYYIMTSFSHQPYNETFILELPDNWMHAQAYNVELDDFMGLINSALDNGFTMAWASDVSEKGFVHKEGVAVIPEGNFKDMTTTEAREYVKKPRPQEKITVESRQEGYDNYTTTDDHGMHITGKYREKQGGTYYKVKNSWGVESNDCDGYLYASEAYVKSKTINVMVHKDALPKSMRKSFGIK